LAGQLLDRVLSGRVPEKVKVQVRPGYKAIGLKEGPSLHTL
jgi:hypothetical protein